MHVEIEERLLDRARCLTGIEDASILIEKALKALVAVEAQKRQAALGGSVADFIRRRAES
jgi:hypothetical protein